AWGRMQASRFFIVNYEETVYVMAGSSDITQNKTTGIQHSITWAFQFERGSAILLKKCDSRLTNI
ncbi:MAG: hypothetical protein V3S33_03815, partial [Gammaproteobacteria bacterium]